MRTGTKIDAETKLSILRLREIPTLLSEGELGLMLDLKVWDPKTGKVLEERTKKSESFVVAFMQMLFMSMKGSYALDQTYNQNRNTFYRMRDIVGDYHNCFELSNHMSASFGTTVSYGGIVVGSGNTAVTLTDYKLATQIAHGTGAGQLSYGSVAFTAPAADSTTSQFTITRSFANGSGGSITVEEVGLYNSVWTIAGDYHYFMSIRDVITAIIVPNGQTLTCNFRPQAIV